MGWTFYNSSGEALIKDGVSIGASKAQMEAASLTDDSVFVTPGRTQNHPGLAKGWAKVLSDASEQDPHYSLSVSAGSTGVYTVTWDTNFSDVDYVVLLNSIGDDTAKAFVEVWSVGSTVVHTYLNGSLAARIFSIAAFGDQ